MISTYECHDYDKKSHVYKETNKSHQVLRFKACMSFKVVPCWSWIGSTCPINSNRVLKGMSISLIFLPDSFNRRLTRNQIKLKSHTSMSVASRICRPWEYTKAGHLATSYWPSCAIKGSKVSWCFMTPHSGPVLFLIESRVIDTNQSVTST